MNRTGLRLGVVVLGILIASLILDYALAYTTINRLEPVEASLDVVGVEGFPPTRIVLEIKLKLYNPLPYSVVVDKYVYEVYVDDLFAGRGEVSGVVIKGNGVTVLPLRVSVGGGELIKAISELMDRGSVKLVIEGYMEVPVRLLGLARVLEASLNPPVFELIVKGWARYSTT